MLLEIVIVPPAATASVPFKSPPDQCKTAPLATVRALFTKPPNQVKTASFASSIVPVMMPPDQVIVPCRVRSPAQLTNNIPLGTFTTPVLVTRQSRVAMPVPATFSNVPKLKKRFVPDWEE